MVSVRRHQAEGHRAAVGEAEGDGVVEQRARGPASGWRACPAPWPARRRAVRRRGRERVVDRTTLVALRLGRAPWPRRTPRRRPRATAAGRSWPWCRAAGRRLGCVAEGGQLGAAEHRHARRDAERLVGLLGEHDVQPLGVGGARRASWRGWRGATGGPATGRRRSGSGVGGELGGLGLGGACGRPGRSPTRSASPVSTSARGRRGGLGVALDGGVRGGEQPGGDGGRALGVERRGGGLLGRGRVQADERVLGAAAGEHERAERGWSRRPGGSGVRAGGARGAGSSGDLLGVVGGPAGRRVGSPGPRAGSPRRRRSATVGRPGPSAPTVWSGSTVPARRARAAPAARRPSPGWRRGATEQHHPDDEQEQPDQGGDDRLDEPRLVDDGQGQRAAAAALGRDDERLGRPGLLAR